MNHRHVVGDPSRSLYIPFHTGFRHWVSTLVGPHRLIGLGDPAAARRYHAHRTRVCGKMDGDRCVAR